MSSPSTGAESDGARGPGRPRTEGHDERILDAVGRLVERGTRVTVDAVVEESGVSRAAVYRRWPSLPELTAEALDRGRVVLDIDTSGGVKEAILQAYFGDPRAARGSDYSDRRFRMRLALVMENPELQQAYWSSHVTRRRVSVYNALAEAVRSGELREDLDLDACIDLINGVFYYQYVVRGTSGGDPDALARCREAFEVAWRGMSARPEG